MTTGFPGEFEIWLRTWGTKPFTPLLRDQAGNILLAVGTTVPANGTAGMAVGCAFLQTSPTRGEQVMATYVNTGTSAYCTFNQVSE